MVNIFQKYNLYFLPTIILSNNPTMKNTITKLVQSLALPFVKSVTKDVKKNKVTIGPETSFKPG